jgi:hypothetical protein
MFDMLKHLLLSLKSQLTATSQGALRKFLFTLRNMIDVFAIGELIPAEFTPENDFV